MTKHDGVITMLNGSRVSGISLEAAAHGDVVLCRSEQPVRRHGTLALVQQIKPFQTPVLQWTVNIKKTLTAISD